MRAVSLGHGGGAWHGRGAAETSGEGVAAVRAAGGGMGVGGEARVGTV